MSRLVEGHVEKDQFSIVQPIGRKDGSIIERIVREDGQFARTDVEVLGRSDIKWSSVNKNCTNPLYRAGRIKYVSI